MAELVATLSHRPPVGPGPQVVEVYGPDGARAALGLAAPVGMRAASAPEPRWGSLQPLFGAGVLGFELAFAGVDGGVLDALRTLYPDERDVWVRLTTPTGRGTTATIDAMVSGVADGRTLAPRVRPSAPVTVEARCGLAKAEKAEATLSGGTIEAAVADALAAVGGPDRQPPAYAVALGIRPTAPVPSAGPPARVTRFDGKVAGSDSLGDYGKAGDVLDALCRAYTLTVYLPATTPAIGLGALSAGERRFYAVPRGLTGQAADAATPGGTSGPIPADVYEAGPLDWMGADTWGYLAPLGLIEFEPTPDVEEARAVLTNGLGVEMGDGETAENAAFSLVADPDLQLRLSASGRVVYDVSTAPAAAPGRVRLVLRDQDGGVHYGTAAGWQSALAEHDLALDGTIDLVVPLTLPAPGTISVVLVGETETYSPDGSAQIDVDAVFNSASLAIENADDDSPVTDVHVTAGEARFGARDATLPLMPPASALTGSGWARVTEWASDVAGSPGGPYRLFAEASAAERLAQEGARVVYVAAFLPGVYLGPETLVRFAGGVEAQAAGSPFAADVDGVAVGLQWDHTKGGTRGVWSALVTDANAGTKQ